MAKTTRDLIIAARLAARNQKLAHDHARHVAAQIAAARGLAPAVTPATPAAVATLPTA